MINHIEVRCDQNVFELVTNIIIKHKASESANGWEGNKQKLIKRRFLNVQKTFIWIQIPKLEL